MDDALWKNEDLSDIESGTEDIGMIEYRDFQEYIIRLCIKFFMTKVSII